MVSIWGDLAAVKEFAGEQWREAMVLPGKPTSWRKRSFTTTKAWTGLRLHGSRVSRRSPRRGTTGSPCRGGVLARARRGSIESTGTLRGCASCHAAAIMDIGSPLEHAEIASERGSGGGTGDRGRAVRSAKLRTASWIGRTKSPRDLPEESHGS